MRAVNHGLQCLPPIQLSSTHGCRATSIQRVFDRTKSATQVTGKVWTLIHNESGDDLLLMSPSNVQLARTMHRVPDVTQRAIGVPNRGGNADRVINVERVCHVVGVSCVRCAEMSRQCRQPTVESVVHEVGETRTCRRTGREATRVCRDVNQAVGSNSIPPDSPEKRLNPLRARRGKEVANVHAKNHRTSHVASRVCGDGLTDLESRRRGVCHEES